ncbi:hypothetical protein BG58_04940 [Caballeronia jiangsuensis]|nr:hypothetical protein BG58_04940 [Caballeronia jiangsuensis]
MLELCCHGRPSELLIVTGFCFSGWNVADRFKQTSVVKPVNPFERREFDSLHVAPWPTTMNDFRLVKAVNRFGKRVIVRIAHAAHGRFDSCFGQAVRVPNGNGLRPAIRMMYQTVTFAWSPFMQRLLQRVEHEIGTR